MSPACISNCADCGIGTITAGEWFMVHNHVWEQAWAGRRKSWQRRVPGQEILCIGCLERRIGRTLTGHDITHARSPISDRLRDRLTTQPELCRRNAPIGAKLTEGQNDGMDELTLLAVADAIKAEAGVTHHRIVDPRREDGCVIFGLAFPQRKIIHAPEGRTPKDLYLLAHECAHVALRHDHQKPRHVREYEAEMWAHVALHRHGVAVPYDSTVDAMLNVFFAISDADERGQFGHRAKRLSLEAAEWSGWNFAQEQQRERGESP
jgi:hypothetical protein